MRERRPCKFTQNCKDYSIINEAALIPHRGAGLSQHGINGNRSVPAMSKVSILRQVSSMHHLLLCLRIQEGPKNSNGSSKCIDGLDGSMENYD